MRRIIFNRLNFMIMFLYMGNFSYSQRLCDVVSNSKMNPVSGVLNFKISNEIIQNDSLKSKFVVFSDSTGKLCFFYDRLNNVYLVPYKYHEDSEYGSLTIYSIQGENLAYWEFINNMNLSHFVEYHYSNKKVKFRRVRFGCPKGEGCKWKNYPKKYFNNLTFESDVAEFEKMVKTIIRNR